MEPEKKEQAAQAQLEITNARALQAQTGCSWTEALKSARAQAPECRIYQNWDEAQLKLAEKAWGHHAVLAPLPPQTWPFDGPLRLDE
jgi:putative SOS response-associated peptidase YedK